jgi:hypothetical protein
VDGGYLDSVEGNRPTLNLPAAVRIDPAMPTLPGPGAEMIRIMVPVPSAAA